MNFTDNRRTGAISDENIITRINAVEKVHLGDGNNKIFVNLSGLQKEVIMLISLTIMVLK